MSFRKIYKIDSRVNYNDSKRKRQLAAVLYTKLISLDIEIINIDESSIPVNYFLQKGWGQRNEKLFYKKLRRLDRISIIAAISTKGRSWFSINFGNNTADTYWYFILRLSGELQKN